MEGIIDTVIVGAGLSGLQAALRLHKAGRLILILEARDRVGGKTHSVERPDGNGIQELGAAWLNDSSQSHLWSYCKMFGLTPVVQNIKGLVASQDADGACHFVPFGEMPKFSKSEVDNIISLRDKVEAASLDSNTFTRSNRAKLDNVTFEQWCRDSGAGVRALQTARVWCRGTLGQDPSDVSALAYLEVARGALGIVNLRYDGKGGAQHLRIKEGTQSIAIGMSKLLPQSTIKLSTPVSSVTRQTWKLYTATTTYGEVFQARKVIPASRFPEANLYHSYALWVLHQVHLLVQNTFLAEEGRLWAHAELPWPMNHCRDTSVDDINNYALTCFLCAGPGREWAALNEDDRRDAILQQLSSLFDTSIDEVKSEFTGSLTSDWMDDKWAGWGCPFAAPPPGTMKDDSQITYKFGGVYFVGTELVDEWRGYMEGALRSGERGASQAISDLQDDDSKL